MYRYDDNNNNIHAFRIFASLPNAILHPIESNYYSGNNRTAAADLHNNTLYAYKRIEEIT